MNKYILAFLTLSVLTGCTSSRAKKVNIPNLLEEMANRGSLAEWPSTEYQTLQTSSYSRESVTPTTADEDATFKPKEGRDWGKGWFANRDFENYIRTEINNDIEEHVMLDAKGPGVVVGLWATGGGDKGSFKVYVDGEVVMDMPVDEFAGYNKQIGETFAFHAPQEAENSEWRGRNFIFPIPYAKSCKITHYGGSGYYHVLYRKYKKDVQVESFTQNTLEKYASRISHYAKKLSVDVIPTGEKIAEAEVILQPGESYTQLIEGQRAIKLLKTKLEAENLNQALRSTVMTIDFDGSNKVWCPIGQFYGIGYKLKPHRTYYINVKENGDMESRWVMPFEKQAKVTFINYGTQNITLKDVSIVHKAKKWTENSLYFNANWWLKTNIETKKKQDANYITINGKGILVGDNLTLFNYFADWSGKNWWGEGDEKIYVDGEKFPSHFGTGTEDYYCYAFCRPQAFSSLIASQPSGEGNKTPGHTSNNRYRLLDAICFQKSLKLDMEIWHPWDGNMDYAPATFWYGDKNATSNIKPNIEMAKEKVTPDLDRSKY